MSTATLKAIKKLVAPYMLNLEERPSDDGPHLVGIGGDGLLHDFLTIEEALTWANQQHYIRNMGQAARNHKE